MEIHIPIFSFGKYGNTKSNPNYYKTQTSLHITSNASQKQD